jgi:hypothetical protein
MGDRELGVRPFASSHHLIGFGQAARKGLF